MIHFAFSGGAPEGAFGEMDLLHSEEFRTGASGDAGESSNTPQEVHAFIAFLEKQQRSSRIDGMLADAKQLRELLATHAARSLDEISSPGLAAFFFTLVVFFFSTSARARQF